MRVRGHHLCCILCYAGSGARSAEEYFGVANAIPALLEKVRGDPDLQIAVAEDFDDVCEICPLRSPQGCGRKADPAAQARKLQAWDRAILQRLGLRPGDVRTARQILQLIRQHIPDIGEICSNCTSSQPHGFQTFKEALKRGLWADNDPEESAAGED